MSCWYPTTKKDFLDGAHLADMRVTDYGHDVFEAVVTTHYKSGQSLFWSPTLGISDYVTGGERDGELMRYVDAGSVSVPSVAEQFA